MPAIVIIPCRYASTRFSGKPLKFLFGKPLIQHVYEGVKRSRSVEKIFIATDNIEIFETVNGFGGQAVMTSEQHQSGTDRIAEALLKIDETDEDILSRADVIVNVQGDEPMIKPQMVDDVVELMLDSKANIGTLAKKINRVEDIVNPNIVKVVLDRESFALYFSRAPIPYHRDIFCHNVLVNNNLDMINMYKHIGIYAYRRDFLLNFIKLPISFLEDTEKLEQLRALENGYKIKVKITPYETLGVDTPEDLEKVRKCLSISS